MPTFDKQDLLDLITEALDSSLGPDWTCRDGSRAVVEALVEDKIIALRENSPKPGSNEWLMQSPNFHPGDLA